jgi:hypothetical protein
VIQTTTMIAADTASFGVVRDADIHMIDEKVVVVVVVVDAVEDTPLEPWQVVVQMVQVRQGVEELIQRMMSMHRRSKRSGIEVAGEVGASYLPKNNYCTTAGHMVPPEAELVLQEKVLQSSPILPPS